MEDNFNELKEYIKKLEQFTLPEYNEISNIPLYMEQVIGYIQEVLAPLSKGEEVSTLITPFMVNNYVKGKVVSAPISKKYNKEHLAQINETCYLKQVLSIAEVKQILDLEYKNNNTYDAYTKFKELSKEKYSDAIEFTKKELENIEETDVSSLLNLSLMLSSVANAYITIAKRILFYCKKYNDMKEIKEELKNKEE